VEDRSGSVLNSNHNRWQAARDLARHQFSGGGRRLAMRRVETDRSSSVATRWVTVGLALVAGDPDPGVARLNYQAPKFAHEPEALLQHDLQEAWSQGIRDVTARWVSEGNKAEETFQRSRGNRRQ